MSKIRIIIIFFICTLIGTIILYVLDFSGFLKNQILNSLTRSQYLGFLTGDIFAMSLLLICIIGLYKMKFWGYIATQIEMGIWIYTSIVSLITTIINGFNDIFVLFWGPVYLLVAIIVIFYTWKIRNQFK